MAPYKIIPNGVEVDRFAPSAVEPIPELCDGRPNILFVGRPEEAEGGRLFTASLPVIKSNFPDARFVVVGAGDWDDSPYRRYIERHDMRDILVVGRVSDAELPRYHRSASVLCSPAVDGESFGIVLLEAMAAGLPVVASDIEGYAQVLTDGREGFLVPPRNERLLADAVCRVLQDRALAATLGANGLISAQEYSWPRIAEQIVDFYVKTGLRSLREYSADFVPSGLVT